MALIRPSHPTGVRGLKFGGCGLAGEDFEVAPHWGTWIEISTFADTSIVSACVAPHWGAWIEIGRARAPPPTWWSHPTGVRGLK